MKVISLHDLEERFYQILDEVGDEGRTPLGANDWAIAWDCATVVNGPRREAPDEETKPSTSAVSKLSLGGSVA